MKTAFYTLLSLFAFAGNSILCRLALGNGAIDAANFTLIRLLSAAAFLFVLIAFFNNKTLVKPTGSWKSGLLLFAYASTFSFAYVSLETGVGALILFTAVQMTMILAALVAGQRLQVTEIFGITAAFAGFVYLMLPAVTAPSFWGSLLMAISGISWGLYSIRGKASENPLWDTSYNFLRTLPLAILLLLVTTADTSMSTKGVCLAVISGALASGAGYTIWYMAVQNLSKIQAAVCQLLVPLIATAGGVFWLNETVSLQLVVAAVLILGGIFLVFLNKHGFVK